MFIYLKFINRSQNIIRELMKGRKKKRKKRGMKEQRKEGREGESKEGRKGGKYNYRSMYN